jgi:hypothetical protein
MRSLIVLAICLLTSTVHAEELRILAWNVESDGNDPNVIVSQLHELKTQMARPKHGLSSYQFPVTSMKMGFQMEMIFLSGNEVNHTSVGC